MTAELIENKNIIVRTSGNIDLSNINEFISVIERAVRKSPEGFIIDLSGSTYIDSAGIQAILGAFRDLRSTNGRLALVVTGKNMKEIIDIVHLDVLPNLFVRNDLASAEEALANG